MPLFSLLLYFLVGSGTFLRSNREKTIHFCVRRFITRIICVVDKMKHIQSNDMTQGDEVYYLLHPFKKKMNQLGESCSLIMR